MSRRKPLSKQTIKGIRQHVLNGKSKTQAANDFGVTFRTVWNHTKDIPTKKLIPQKVKDEIRAKVKSGQSKYQTAKEYHLHTNTVYQITKDLPSAPSGWPGIRGKTLDMLQELLANGYVCSTCRNVQQRYRTLKKYFPMICKISMYNRTIFYPEGRQDVAARAFLREIDRKIMSYQELREVTKVFGTDISKRKKRRSFSKTNL